MKSNTAARLNLGLEASALARLAFKRGEEALLQTTGVFKS